MANIEIEIAARKYLVACRDGEEDNLRAAAALVEARARDASAALGNLSEARTLLFAALLLADDVRSAPAPDQAARPATDPAVIDAVEALAARMESLAERLEQSGPNP